jgi:hypothetical protein
MSAAGIAALPSIVSLRGAGCARVVAKLLAPNDNTKNQIYLGGNFDVLNVLPFHSPRTERSGTSSIIKASVEWQWLQPDGSTVPAPGAQLILYPQYPEVRLSGLLRGVPNGKAPNKIIATRDDGRVLLMGILPDGRVLATALPAVHPDALVVRRDHALLSTSGVLLEIPLREGSPVESDARTQLLEALLRVHQQGWINGCRLRAEGPSIPYRAPNGVGYTLEAQLGIRPNGRSDPDFLGWEVKAISGTRPDHITNSKRVTLLTPNPTGGEFARIGPAAFVRRYGHVDTHMSDRLNFSGTFRVGKAVGPHSLELLVEGFDPATGTRFDADGAVRLNTTSRNAAIEWSLVKMVEHWNRKHARAVYVPAITRQTPAGRSYSYGRRVFLGTGTDFARMLRAVASGRLVYDPGVKLEHVGGPEESLKQRHQFRIPFSALSSLYEKWEQVDLEADA